MHASQLNKNILKLLHTAQRTFFLITITRNFIDNSVNKKFNDNCRLFKRARVRIRDKASPQGKDFFLSCVSLATVHQLRSFVGHCSW